MRNLLDLIQIEQREIKPLISYINSISGVLISNGIVKGTLSCSDTSVYGNLSSRGILGIDSKSKEIYIGEKSGLGGFFAKKDSNFLINCGEIEAFSPDNSLRIDSSSINAEAYIKLQRGDSELSLHHDTVEILPQKRIGKINKCYRCVNSFDGQEQHDLYKFSYSENDSLHLDFFISSGETAYKAQKSFDWDVNGVIKQSPFEDPYVKAQVTKRGGQLVAIISLRGPIKCCCEITVVAK